MNNINKKVVIFGGTGFVGSYIVRALAREGYLINIVTRNPENIRHLKPMGYVGQISATTVDVTKKDLDFGYLFKDCFAVINLVGILYQTKSQTFDKVHTELPKKLAMEAKKHGVERFIQFSALGVDKALTSEYAKSKIAGEKAVMQNFPNAIFIRPSVIFGAEDNFLNKFAKMAKISPFLPAPCWGKTKFQPVYVADVAEGIVAILKSEIKKEHTIYEFAGPCVYNFHEILRYIIDHIGKRRMVLLLPVVVSKIMGFIFEKIMPQLLTSDQVKLLDYDNIIKDEDKLHLQDLSINPTSMDMVVPAYLKKYRN